MDPQESKIYLRVLVFCVLLAIIIAGFIISFVRQQKKLIHEKLMAEINTSEEERKKLSSDLHDDLGPVLATIKIYVNALSQQDERDKKLIANINKYLDGGIMHVRTMANGLLPNTLQRKGLQKALEEYVDNITLYVPFEIHLLFQEPLPDLNEEASLNIYRIIQEIITNTIKHSRAKVLQLNFERRNNTLEIYTEDDGVGFDYTDHNFVPGGNGLSNIKSRIEMLKGKCTIYSREGEGARYVLAIPITKHIAA